MVSVENRIAIITGATGGLGSVVAQKFAEQGARLVLVSTKFCCIS
jgi:NAD(P)-dependent dehydrogenase (short-subunit alcohol dehydrogenase family)